MEKRLWRRPQKQEIRLNGFTPPLHLCSHILDLQSMREQQNCVKRTSSSRTSKTTKNIKTETSKMKWNGNYKKFPRNPVRNLYWKLNLLKFFTILFDVPCNSKFFDVPIVENIGSDTSKLLLVNLAFCFFGSNIYFWSSVKLQMIQKCSLALA